MAAKRTPLGHKRRGEAKVGILPVGGEGPGGRKLLHPNGSVGRVHKALIRQARGPDGEGGPTAPGGALPQRIFNARHETTTTQTVTGKRGYVPGFKSGPQFNPDNSQRASWGVWKPGGG